MMDGKHEVVRYHDISCGHRVHGHEGKCRHLHGHNYRVHFTCVADTLDDLGRVIDFSVIKEKLCMWIEDNWDHKFLAWDQDPIVLTISNCLNRTAKPGEIESVANDSLIESLVWVPFNPTAENLGQHLVDVIGPQQLKGTGVKLVKVVIEETRKCFATYGIQ